jgi:SPP1 gp7 family putative phage head morphogenesis protein
MMNLRPFLFFNLSDTQKLSLIERLLQNESVVVDYELIEKTFETIENAAVEGISDAIKQARDDLIEYINRKFDPETTDMAWVLNVKVRAWEDVRKTMREAIGASFVAGRSQFRREATGAAELRIRMTPREAAKFLDEKMFWITGVMRDTLTRKAQSVLAAALENGESKEQTMEKLEELFAPYVGAEVAGEVVSPARLETIVRTNITDAYNQGRLQEMEDPDIADFIEGVRYSAVIDTRTTEICNLLHDKVFEKGSTAVHRLTPPNHYNCRSVIVPVTIGEDIDESERIDNETINRALGMVKTSFGGDSAELSQLVEGETESDQNSDSQ